jgi:hypothetical protein
MPFTTAQIADMFTYHPPSAADQAAYEAIRSKAREFAETILAHTPMSPDQTTAIRKLREAVMTANAAIALGGKF